MGRNKNVSNISAASNGWDASKGWYVSNGRDASNDWDVSNGCDANISLNKQQESRYQQRGLPGTGTSGNNKDASKQQGLQ
jgi:hypothetical protein